MLDSPQIDAVRRTAHWKWLAAALVLVFLRALPNLRYIMGHDQATYCLIGQGLLHGKLLYRDLWDNKPPGVFYIYAVIVKIFGPVMWSIGVVDILWLLAISCCIFYFSRRFLGTPGGALTVVFLACRHCRQGYLHAGQVETFLMLFIFGAWFLLSDPPAGPLTSDNHQPPGKRQTWGPLIARYFGVGVILGCAFWLKYNAIIFFPFLALLPFLDFSSLDVAGNSKVEDRKSKIEHRGSELESSIPESGRQSPESLLPHLADAPDIANTKSLAAILRLPRLLIPWKDWFARMVVLSAGFFFTVAAVLIYFRLAGAWPAMREVQFVVMPRYGAMALHWNFKWMVWGLWQSQNHIGIWWEIMPAIALLIALWRRELRIVVPLTLMALAGYTCTAVQGRFHPYYFETTYPFLAPFWGYVCIKTYQGFLRIQQLFVERRWALARALLWVAFAGLALSLLPEEGARVVEQYHFAADWWRNPEYSYKTYYWQMPIAKIGDQLRVIDYLKANSRPQDEVFVWGTAPLISFLSQRPYPSRFVSNLSLMSVWAPDSWRQELVSTLQTHRPAYIIVARNDMIPTVTFTDMDSEDYLQVYPALIGFMRQNYAPAINYTDYEIYKLKT